MEPYWVILYFISIVCAAIGTVLAIFLLEKLWAAINGFVPINQMAEEALDKMYEDSDMPRWGLNKPKQFVEKMISDTTKN